MRIGTTPTHTFTLPFDTEIIRAVEITYSQNGKVVLKKDQRDCTLSGNTISTKLSQLDTFEFDECSHVEIQIRIMDHEESVFASDIIRVSCKKCLSDEVLR